MNRCRGGRGSSADGLVCCEPPEYLVADSSAEGPDRLGLGIAGGHSLGDVVASGSRPLKLRYRDPVEGDIELMITAAIALVTGSPSSPPPDHQFQARAL